MDIKAVTITADRGFPDNTPIRVWQAAPLDVTVAPYGGDDYDDALSLVLEIHSSQAVPGSVPVATVEIGPTERVFSLTGPQMNQIVGPDRPYQDYWMFAVAVYADERVEPLFGKILRMTATRYSGTVADPPSAISYLTAAQASSLYATLAALATEASTRAAADTALSNRVTELESAPAATSSTLSASGGRPLVEVLLDELPHQTRREIAAVHPDAAPLVIATHAQNYALTNATRNVLSAFASLSGAAAAIRTAHPRAIDLAAAAIAVNGSGAGMTVAKLSAMSTFSGAEYDFARREPGARLWLGGLGALPIDALHPAALRPWAPDLPHNTLSFSGTVTAHALAGHYVSDGSTGLLNLGTSTREAVESGTYCLAWYSAGLRGTEGANVMIGQATGRCFASLQGNAGQEYYRFAPSISSGEFRTDTIAEVTGHGLILCHYDGTTGHIYQRKAAGGTELTIQAASPPAPALNMSPLTGFSYGGVAHLTPIGALYAGPLIGGTRAAMASALFALITGTGTASV